MVRLGARAGMVAALLGGAACGADDVGAARIDRDGAAPDATGVDAAAAGEGGVADGGAGDATDSAAPSDAAREAGPDAGPEAGGDAGGDADAGPAQAIAVPLYIDPTASPAAWTQMVAAAPTVALLVANPNSGPGTKTDPQYTAELARVHAAGQQVIGYVHTSYGARALATVEADVDAWYAMYPTIDGIFVDETSSKPATVAPYYQPLHDYVHAKPGAHVVASNPGTIVDESFMATTEILVTFEDTYAHYTDGSYPPNPAWVASYPRWRFWHLVLSAATPAAMTDAVTRARARNVGYVYVTDQAPAKAYQVLASGAYWTGELAAVSAP